MVFSLFPPCIDTLNKWILLFPERGHSKKSKWISKNSLLIMNSEYWSINVQIENDRKLYLSLIVV